MKTEQFDKHVEEQIERCRDMLIKRSSYGSEADRLHNFTAFAELSGESPEEVCWGYCGKHLVSISDMVKNTGKGTTYLLPQWDEKIGDAINYLLILAAIVREEKEMPEDKRSEFLWKEFCRKHENPHLKIDDSEYHMLKDANSDVGTA